MSRPSWRALLLYATSLAIFARVLVSHSELLWSRCASSVPCVRQLQPSLFSALGWHPVDVSDPQWRTFREKLVLLIPVALVHSGIGALVRVRLCAGRACVAYDAASGVALVVFIHRAQAAHLFVFAAAHHLLCRGCRSFPATQLIRAARIVLLGRARDKDTTADAEAAAVNAGVVTLSTSASWLFILCLLLLRSLGRRALKYRVLLGADYAWLDGGAYGGMGWWDHANLLALRMHSHAVDEAAAAAAAADRCPASDGISVGVDGSNAAGDGPAGSGETPCAAPPDRMRGGTLAWLAYLFYAPLYIAGPVMRADDFVAPPSGRGASVPADERPGGVPSRTPRTDGVAVYALRWLLCLGVMEALSARAPCFALARARLAGDLGAAEGLSFSYLSLKLIWLKFVLIWRFFTLWARLDGRRPPENLPRCMSNHYSILGFWRSWHRSFSLWLLHYLYLPLGGRTHRIRNLAATFGFVALWHGVEARMLGWAALTLVALTPEVLAARSVAARPALRARWYYRHLVAAGGASAISLLMAANLVGFGSGGADAVQTALRQVLAPRVSPRRLAERALEGTDAVGDAEVLKAAEQDDSAAENVPTDGLLAAAAAWGLLFVGVQMMQDLERWRAGKQARARAE